MNSIIAEEDNPATEESLFLKSENSQSLILDEDDDDSPRLKAKLRAQRAKLEKYAHILKRQGDVNVGAESESGGGQSSNTTPVPGS
jgi:hypothetical protein